MRRREAVSARYSSKNDLVACGIQEPFNEVATSEPLVFSLKLLPYFKGQLAIRDGGGHIVIKCKDVASKRALLSAIENVLLDRNLDERQWRDDPDRLREEREEGT